MPTPGAVPLTIVDAFTDVAFAGNPAGVCRLDRWPVDLFQSIAPPSTPMRDAK